MSRKQRLTAVVTRYADHVTPLYPRKLALTSPTGGGRSVGIVRVRTKATELLLLFLLPYFCRVFAIIHLKRSLLLGYFIYIYIWFPVIPQGNIGPSQSFAI